MPQNRRLKRRALRRKGGVPVLRLVGLGVFAVLLIVAFVARHSIFDSLEELLAKTTNATLESILVEGVQYTSAEELGEALGMKRGDSLVGFQASAARARLEVLPWVRQAAVSRKLPDTIKVNVYEYFPLARLETDEGEMLVNKEGSIITAADAKFDDLPLVRGAHAAPHVAQLFSLLQSEDVIRSHVDVAEWIGDRRWNIKMKSGITVMLPEERVGQALATLNELQQARDILNVTGGTVDLRIEDKITLNLPEDVDIPSLVSGEGV